MKKLVVILLCCFPFAGIGQDIHFSQTTRAAFQINPAFTGAFQGNFQATINFKDQWQSVNNTFRTFGASVEASLGKRNQKLPASFALGGHVYRDVAGDIQMGNTNVGVNFGTLVKVSHNARLIAGIQGSWGQTGLDVSKMQWGSQYDGLNYDPSLFNGESYEYQSFNYVDVAAGVGLWWRKIDRNVAAASAQDVRCGFAVYHFNRPRFSFAQNDDVIVPMRFVANLSAILETRWENFYWFPNLTGVYQGGQHEVLVGSLWKARMAASSKKTGYKAESSFAFGMDLRVTNVVDAIIPQIYLELFNVAFGVSYDVNVSKLRNASQYRGGVELSLRFTNPDQYIHRNPFRYVPYI